MMKKNAKKFILTISALLVLVLILVACQSSPTPGPVTPRAGLGSSGEWIRTGR